MIEKRNLRIKVLSIVVSFLLLIPIVVVSATGGGDGEMSPSVAVVSEQPNTAVSTTIEQLSEEVTTVVVEKTTEEVTTEEATTESTTVKENVTESFEEEEVEEEVVYEEIPTTVNTFYDEDDLYILSHLIYGEAGGQSDECQLAVGSVVLNRVKSSSFPNSISGVVFAPGQYACTWDGNYDKEPDARAIKNARYLLEHGSQLPDGVVFQAQFVQGEVYAVIDGEYFCYG